MIEPFKFDYSRYKSRGVSTEKLDELMDYVIRPEGNGLFKVILSGVKLLVVSSYLIARKNIVDTELMIEKQEYEKRRGDQTTAQIGSDSLDGQQKPR